MNAVETVGAGVGYVYDKVGDVIIGTISVSAAAVGACGETGANIVDAIASFTVGFSTAVDYHNNDLEAEKAAMIEKYFFAGK